MEQPLAIAEIVRRTGLTHRALRFYEARGLVAPIRTASGRRYYDRAALERLDRIVALKAAGFSLAEIGGLLASRRVDLAGLLAARIEALDAQAARLGEARRLLLTAKSRVDRGEPLDAATLCSLIRTGDALMENENWKAVADRYVDPANRTDWERSREKMDPGFDQAGYMSQWIELASRVQAALPLDPASPEAQSLYDEWQALLAPFTAVATPGMATDVKRFYDNMGAWEGEMKPPFSAAVWAFIKAAAAARTG